MYYSPYGPQYHIPKEDEYYLGRKLTELFSTYDLCCKDMYLLFHDAKYKLSKDEYWELIVDGILSQMRRGLQRTLCFMCERQKTCREKVIIK